MLVKNLSDSVPKPIRILAQWPDGASRQLEYKLRNLIREGKIILDRSQMDKLSINLKQAGYYHVLVISPKAFFGLHESQRVKYLRNISLLYLAPGVAPPNLTSFLTKPTVYFDSDWDISQHTNLLVGISLALVNANPILTALSYPWVEPDSLPPGLSVEYTGQNNAIWPAAEKIHQGPDKRIQKGIPIKDQHIPAGSSPLVLIQNAGNVVHGNLIQQKADTQVNITRGVGDNTQIQQDAIKDQINLTTIRGNKSEIHQNAGLDQMNINRVTGEPGSIKQSAGNDQVNINRISQIQIERCPHCNFEIKPSDTYCKSCFHTLRS